jgi:flagellar operon protein
VTERLTIIPQPVVPRSRQGVAGRTADVAGSGRFDQLLQNRIEAKGIKFSRHAVDRMNSRGIQLSPVQMQRLQTAVSQVDAKGGRESLVLIDQTALVVSVKNETVVTVIDHEQMRNNVFTHIDSAVIA